MASLRDADLKKKLGARESEERIVKAQHRLLALRLQMGGLIGDGTLGPPLCILFEGWDASGKGGSIRRLVSPLDPRHVRVAQFAAPTADERTTTGRMLKGSALRSVRLYHEGEKGRLAESGPRRTGQSRFVSAYKSRARQTWGMPRPLMCGHCPHPSNH